MQYLFETPRKFLSSSHSASLLILFICATLSTTSFAQQMTLSEAVQTPSNIVAPDTPITYQFKIENPTLIEYDPPWPEGSDGTVETYIQIRIDGELVIAAGGPISSTVCGVHSDPYYFRCNDLEIDESQTVIFTWDSPEAGLKEVDFVGTWNFVPPDILVGGTSVPHTQVFDTYIGYEKRQTLYESIEFLGNFPATSANGTVGITWDGETTLDLVAGGDPYCDFGTEFLKSCLADGGVACEEGGGTCVAHLPSTGFALTLESAGSTGLNIQVERPAVSYSGEMPLSVTFDLPEDGVVAPEELFTISTNWGTPYGTRLPLNGGARFETSDPGSIEVRLGQAMELQFGVTTLGCFDGKCEAGQMDELPDPVIDYLEFITVGLNDEKNNFIASVFDGVEEFSWPEFLTKAGLSPSSIPDPIEMDVLRVIMPDLAGLSRMGIGTNYDKVGSVSATTSTQVPKYRSLSNGWSENAFHLSFDLTNIGPIAKNLACNCFVPLLNGTAADLSAIALAKVTPENPLGKKTSKALNTLYWVGDGLQYTVVEAELNGQFDVANNFQLTPQAPMLKIMNGDESLSNWFKAGDDVEVIMPIDPSDITVEIKLDSSFNSNLIVWERDVVIDFNALSLEFFTHSTDWWWSNPLRKKFYSRDGGQNILGQTRQSDQITSDIFERQLYFPEVLSEPRVALSGGGEITFGGQDGGCWDPDNLPPDVPSGITWNENDGCVVSFRQLGLNGQILFKSFSNSEISLTLQNSTLVGQGSDPAQVELNPNGNTSVQFRGGVRQSGFDNVDLFFNDALSSGNHNRLIFDTTFGGFIRDSLLRGKISNENQSDIILESGNLWIENTDMELDNITVVHGKISMQDSVAELRNLQLGGGAESALRMTRDSLITTSSNASFSSTLLEVGNGSLVNVSGQMDNYGEIDLELGGWLAVLEGDDPLLPDRLTNNGQDPGIVNIVGMNYLEVTREALALVPNPIPDPASLFENQIDGSRLESGVLLLGGGEIVNQVINNVGGSFLALGGVISNVTINMGETANMLISRAPTMFNQSTISGTGNIEIESTGAWALNQAEIGDTGGDPNGLTVKNKGVISVTSTAEFLSNSTIINEGTIEVGTARELTVANLNQVSGLLDIDGTMNVTQTAQLFGGQMGGMGTINGNLIVTNGELIANGPTIVGDFIHDAQASLLLDLSTTPAPEISVGTAELNGRLTIIMTQDYVDTLVVGSGFEFMSYDSVTGNFTSVVLLLPDGSAVQDVGAEVIYGSGAASVRWLEADENREELGELPVFRSSFEFD